MYKKFLNITMPISRSESIENYFHIVESSQDEYFDIYIYENFDIYEYFNEYYYLLKVGLLKPALNFNQN